MSVNVKRQVSIIGFSTALAAFSLGSIISFTDPSNTSWLTFSFFYISLFLLCLGATTLLGLFIRNWLIPGLFIINFGHSLRQAILISLLITSSFFLLSFGLLFWWVELSLILFLATIEIFLNLKL